MSTTYRLEFTKIFEECLKQGMTTNDAREYATIEMDGRKSYRFNYSISGMLTMFPMFVTVKGTSEAHAKELALLEIKRGNILAEGREITIH